MNSKSLVKCVNEITFKNAKSNENCDKSMQEQSIQENTDLNLMNQKYFELSKYHEDMNLYLEDELQLQVLNYRKLYNEYINLFGYMETSWRLQIDTESSLRAEIILKSTGIEYTQNQIHDTSLQFKYEKLEEQFMLKSCECDEAQSKILNLEFMLFTLAENEKVLKNNLESKSIALEEYKKYVELLLSGNNSFQTRANGSEDNVLVDISEEFDLIKSELANKTEYEQNFLDGKADLQCKYNVLKEKLSSFNEEIALNDEGTEDLPSVINFLVTEVKDANYDKRSLECRLNKAEHHVLIIRNIVEYFELHLHTAKREYENVCTSIKCIENELNSPKSKSNGKINQNHLDSSCDVRNQLFDPLVDYIQSIKLNLSELYSAITSGNQTEKLFTTKSMSIEDVILPATDGVRKGSCDALVSPNNEIDNLEDKVDLTNTLPKAKTDVDNNVDEILDQKRKLSNENNELLNCIELMKNDLNEKDSLVSKLNSELSEVKIQYETLEKHNQNLREQINHSFDIDAELKSGKMNLLSEINILEPGKIPSILPHHNLSNMLDLFVSLIMIKEQQIITNFDDGHSKDKQEYEEKIKQLQEDIEQGKEWQTQVESDNVKLCLELEILKSEKRSFLNREIEINELTKKMLKTELQYSVLSELQNLKARFNMMSHQTYQILSNEFEFLETGSEQSVLDLKTKLEDLTSKFNESLVMYKEQPNSRSILEGQVEKTQSECGGLKAIIEKKDEDIKNIINQLKTKEYKESFEKNILQREEMKDIHGENIDELLMELNDESQEIYNTEKLLKEINKNHNQLQEENSSNVLKVKHENDNSVLNAKTYELEHNIQTDSDIIIKKLESLENKLKLTDTKFEESEGQRSIVIQELELHKFKIIALEKKLESSYEILKLKDDQNENYNTKLKINNDDSIEINNIIDKLRKILKCNGTLSELYENVSSLVAKCEDIKEEMKEIKQSNIDLCHKYELILIETKKKTKK